MLGGPQPGGSIAVIPDIFGIVEVAAAVITNFPKFSIVGFVYEGTALAVYRCIPDMRPSPSLCSIM